MRILTLRSILEPARISHAILRARILQSLGYEPGHIVLGGFRQVEMASAGIAQEGDTAVGIHHLESEGRTQTRVPPFILPHHHQCRNAVDVAGAPPLHVGAAIAAQVGARSIAVIRYHAQRTVRIPRREIPRKRGLRRMPERYYPGGLYLIVARHRGQRVDDAFEAFLTTRGRVPVLRTALHEHHSHAERIHPVRKRRRAEQHLLRHILMRIQHRLHRFLFRQAQTYPLPVAAIHVVEYLSLPGISHGDYSYQRQHACRYSPYSWSHINPVELPPLV